MRLTWGGCDCRELALAYGTPLYVMDQARLEAKMHAYLAAAERAYRGLRVAYAGKAFLCGAMVRMVQSLGMWLDVVSGGELCLALGAGMDPERILFHGNNKSPAELQAAVAAGVGRIVIDNFMEIDRLASVAAAAGRRAEVMVRITPGVLPRTHRAIQTGQLDSKFGFPVGDGTALEAIEWVLSHGSLRLRGLHCHIGSQVTMVEPFRLAARTMARVAWEAWERTGYLAEEVNLGGGWAGGLPSGSPAFPIETYVAAVAGSFRHAWRKHGRGRADLSWPALFIEPGRSIVAEAGITLYTVGAIKPVPGHDPYLLVDGGMTDNPRPMLYGSMYQAVVVDRPDAPATVSYTVAGKACESGDVLIRGARLPEVAPGDLLAVLSTGAYNHSMSSNYNRLERPAVVFAGGGRSRLVVRRETPADLLATDLELDTGPVGRSEPGRPDPGTLTRAQVAAGESRP